MLKADRSFPTFAFAGLLVVIAAALIGYGTIGFYELGLEITEAVVQGQAE